MLLLAPPVVLLAMAFVYPVGKVLVSSFTEPEPGFGQYIDLLTEPSNLAILQRTFLLALIVTIATLLLSYPYAYALTLATGRLKLLLIALVLLPFWISLIARTFAWMVLLQRGGPIQQLTSFLGITDEAMIGSFGAVAIAMVQVLLPYMVLPLYNAMSDIDTGLMKAAGSLGAKRVTQFFTVFLPLSMPGVIAGVVLVFVLSLGFYLTPELIGSPQQPVAGQLIATKVQKLLDFSGAGALSMVLLVVTFVLMGLTSRFGGGAGGAVAGVAVLQGKGR